MNIPFLIARHVLDVHEGGNWTEVDITSTLKDVTLQQAVSLTPGSPNTIAALLHHLTYWNRVMVSRINGTAVVVPEANGFDAPVLNVEQDWEVLKEDNLRSARELAAAITGCQEYNLSAPILPGYPSAYKSLQGSVEHIHYHLGQIVILKHLIKGNYCN
ncbi:MAG: DinB family protein [Sphingobacteriaceae bacterium]|nr:MAG: DinB family protein [Sphingobacteriaceae bacterium]